MAQAASAPQAIDIPAGNLAQALERLGEQTGVLITYAPGLVQGVRVSSVSGQLAPGDALRRLLEGSGIQAEAVNDKTFVLKRAATPSAAPRPSTPAQRAPAASEVQQLGGLTVTGTRIRGGETPSPVITIGSERIREEGFTDLGDVMRSIPQNYGGGQNPGVTAGAWQGGMYNQNVTGGSAANLRGIGQDATLTLLNGRRMSYGGYDQAVDISSIPVEAVERMEIVTDGASAIYGSDAVGGVVNVMLRRDFDGVAVSARYGEATQGGLATREYTATAGTAWSTGGLIATFKKAENDPIFADQRDYTQQMYDPSTLYQQGELESGLLSIHQSVGESVEVQFDALRTVRDSYRLYGYATNYLEYPTDTTTNLWSPSVIVSLSNDWTLNASAAFGRDKTNFIAYRFDRATGAQTLNNAFNYGNESRMYEVGAEGPLFALAGGDARLAIGAGYRHNDFLYLFNNGPTADGDEGSRFAYAELDLPLVAPGQGIGGVHRFSLTGAVRTEDYDSYGGVTTPKLGLIYSPTVDWTLKASWGKSFKTPTLYQGYIGQFSYLYPATTFGGAAGTTALYLNGGNRNLDPERARSWAATIAFHPEALPGLEAELTAYSIDYTDRIVQPLTTTSELLSSSFWDDFILRNPTAAQQAEIIAITQYVNYTGNPYDPADMVAIIDNRFVNAAEQRIKGVDLSASQRFDLAASRLTLRGSLSWLDIEQSLTASSRFMDGSGVLFYPAELSSRIGAVWSIDGFTASLFASYKSGVTDTANNTKGGSFTTFDTTLRYDTGAGDSVFSDMGFEFSAQNLLNRDPPLYALSVLSNAPYDSTNYPVIGRFLSVTVSKRW